jgi:hypothetical protein
MKVTTELDYFIFCLKELSRLRETSLVEADKFKKEMLEYFRLPYEMDSVFINDALLRLADTPAGTSKGRNDEYLKQLHAMENGDSFELYDRACVFRYHMRGEHPLDGFFEYVYEESRSSYRTLNYNEAWSLLTDGKMVLHVPRN